jgi:hypothetical protein
MNLQKCTRKSPNSRSPQNSRRYSKEVHKIPRGIQKKFTKFQEVFKRSSQNSRRYSEEVKKFKKKLKMPECET